MKNGSRFARTLAVSAAALATATVSALAQAQNLSSCPVTRLVFQDSADGRLFRVDAVGRLSYVWCGDVAVPVAADGPVSQDCSRPVFHVILEGLFDDPAANGTSSSNTWAVWSVLPAAPCCSWYFDLAENGAGLIAGHVEDQEALFGLIEWEGAGTQATINSIGAEPTINRSRGAIGNASELVPLLCLPG